MDMLSIRLLYVIAHLFATVSSVWEIPFNISQYFLKVIGGYPTLIESFYPSVENLTYDELDSFPLSLQSSSYHRLLSWSCDAFPSDGSECTSTINADKCRHGTQFAVGFWPAANRSCEKQGQLVPCQDATLEGNVCQNAVVSIYNKSAAHFVLKDVQVPSIITQTFTVHRGSNTSCYFPSFPVLGDQLLRLFPTGDHCGTGQNLIKFGVNTTVQCMAKRSAFDAVDGCPSDEQLKTFLTSEVSYICNCGKCDVPLMRQPSSIHNYNTTSCVAIHQATMTFTFRNGSINGARIRYDYRNVSVLEEHLLLTVRIRFIEYRTPCQKTRFELQRGRFHCPSDVTCWQELWLPLMDVSPSTVPLLGCAVIVVLRFVFALVKRRRKLSDPSCDCQFALSQLYGPLKLSKKMQ
nr:Hypothetical protein CBG18076 [Haemonchus contortus]